MVEEAGVDTGYAPESDLLRAPDVAVGNVPDQRGWVRGVPRLAVEYADSGQDEAELQKKIVEFTSRGTQHFWVVRLLGPWRVEVYEPGQPPRTVLPGEMLRAPGILKNPVSVEALYDRDAAHETMLRNLLQRRGYSGLDEVRQLGIELGREKGLELGRKKGFEQVIRAAIGDLCEALGIELTEERRARIEQMDLPALNELRAALKRSRRFPE
jgi:hypothetical protein